MFWVAAVAILTVSGLVLAWPLLSRGSNWKAAGLTVLLMLPLGGTLLYREVGTPLAIDATATPVEETDFDVIADDLRSRLSESEEDLEGWLLLGRSLKSLQRFDEAVEALETAQRIAPESPLVKVELAEAILFASGDPRLSDDVLTMLQTAVTEEPGLQKGLWLLGIDAVQRGEDRQAIEYWQRLLGQIGPNSSIASSVEEQIELARARLGSDSPAQTAEMDAWPGVDVEIILSSEAVQGLPQPLPAAAVLFVIVRPQAETAGPPLGVARVDQLEFPIGITIDDRHAMLPQRLLSGQPRLRLQARLSLSGQPGAQPGDWESQSVDITAENPGSVTLSLATQSH